MIQRPGRISAIRTSSFDIALLDPIPAWQTHHEDASQTLLKSRDRFGLLRQCNMAPPGRHRKAEEGKIGVGMSA